MMFNRNSNEEKKIFDFYYTELPAIEQYLEKQEREGYRLKEIKYNTTMIFEKCEPREIRYCAEIFKGSSTEEFIESCESKGWELAGQCNNELYIFRTQKSDAVDIMTDEKEKLRICAKRIAHQPGRWTFLGLAVFSIIRLLSAVNGDVETVLFETNVLNFYSLMMIGFYLLINIVKIFDHVLWRFTSLRNNTNSKFTSLKNTIRKRRVYALFVCVYLIVSHLVILWIDPAFRASDSAIENTVLAAFIVCLFLGSINHFLLSKLSFNKKDKSVKVIKALIITAIITCGLFAMGNYSQKMSAEFSKEMLSLEDIPVSLTDLGVEVEKSADKGSVKGTRFGQFYRFTSSAEHYETGENISGYMHYIVLVSDYPDVRQHFIDKILKEYSESELDFVKITSPETEWDYYCKVKKEDVNEYDGFAVKDNTVIFLRWPVQCEKDFFEVAYENLFAE